MSWTRIQRRTGGRRSCQLFYGGRDAQLRGGNVLESLTALCRAGLLPEATAESLRESYSWLRRSEHALQLVEEQQTAAFPRDPAAQLALARRMGYEQAAANRARDALLEDWASVRNEVRGHFDALVLKDPQ